jgi:hypothetical protein
MPTAEQAKGREFEREMAKLLGGKRDPTSGAISGHDLVLEPQGIFADFAWELKRRHAIPNLVSTALAQSQVGIRIGNSRRPAMAMRGDGGRAVVAMYATDFVTWATALSEMGQGSHVRAYARELERIAAEMRRLF